MSHAEVRHPEPADLVGIQLDPEHAWHSHVDGCARCQAVLAQYHDFMADEPIPAGADLAQAEQVLAASLAAEMTPSRDGWWQRLFGGSVLRPAMAAVVVLLGVGLIFTWPNDPEPGVRRGGEDSTFTLQPAAWNETEITLDWSPVPTANAYRVRVLTASLEAVLTREVDEPTLTLARDELAPHDRLIWRVTALRDGEELETSAPSTVVFDQP